MSLAAVPARSSCGLAFARVQRLVFRAAAVPGRADLASKLNSLRRQGGSARRLAAAHSGPPTVAQAATTMTQAGLASLRHLYATIPRSRLPVAALGALPV